MNQALKSFKDGYMLSVQVKNDYYQEEKFIDIISSTGMEDCVEIDEVVNFDKDYDINGSIEIVSEFSKKGGIVKLISKKLVIDRSLIINEVKITDDILVGDDFIDNNKITIESTSDIDPSNLLIFDSNNINENDSNTFTDINIKNSFDESCKGSIIIDLPDFDKITKLEIMDTTDTECKIIYNLPGDTKKYTSAQLSATPLNYKDAFELGFLMTTTNINRTPTINTINIFYTKNNILYSTVVEPKNLVRLVNNLYSFIEGDINVNGDTISTTKALIVSQKLSIDPSSSYELVHVEDEYGYRLIDVSIKNISGNYEPISNLVGGTVEVLKQTSKKTVIKNNGLTKIDISVSMVIPKTNYKKIT